VTSPSGDDAWADPVESRPLSPEEEGYRSEVERAWFKVDGGLGKRALRAQVVALALGIENLDPAARALIAPGDSGNALTNAMLSVRLAPDLPIAHMALARVMWREGDRIEAVDRAASGVMAIFQNFEATAWLVGSLLVMAAVVLVAAPLFFVMSVGISVFGRASHDLGDLVSPRLPNFARAALLGTVLLLPMAFGEGIVGFAMVLFALGFTYGDSGYRVALGLAIAFFVMGMYPVANTASTVLTALDSDPVAAATLAVVQGLESEADIELLERASESEFVAAHILAVRSRRLGRTQEALDRYTELLESHPRNPEVLTNLANLRFLTGDGEGAVELYERSAALIDSARLMFNLSQANARMFRIEEFEFALRAAQSVDSNAVANLSRIGDANFVADLEFPLSALRSRLLIAAEEQGTPRQAIELLMPGWLGRDWIHLAFAFALVAVGSLVLSTRFDQAGTCRRCGRRICARCDGTLWNNETCDGCHYLFHRPETTDPVLRMKRLSELQARDTRISRVASVVSLLIPGVGGLLARRPDLGFLGVLSFGFAAVFFAWHDGVVPDPLSVGAAGSLAFMAAGCVSALVYLAIVSAGLMIRRNL
jgi:Flp pilus assembly protein TadD